MIILRISAGFLMLAFMTLPGGCGGYDTYGASQGVQTSLEGQRSCPNPNHLKRQPGERRSNLKVRVQFVQQAVGSCARNPDKLCLFVNDERVQRMGWEKPIDFPGTKYDVLYYDKTIRPGRYKIKFYDYFGEPNTTAYDFDIDAGNWYILYITIRNNKHFYRLEQEL